MSKGISKANYIMTTASGKQYDVKFTVTAEDGSEVLDGGDWAEGKMDVKCEVEMPTKTALKFESAEIPANGTLRDIPEGDLNFIAKADDITDEITLFDCKFVAGGDLVQGDRVTKPAETGNVKYKVLVAGEERGFGERNGRLIAPVPGTE